MDKAAMEVMAVAVAVMTTLRNQLPDNLKKKMNPNHDMPAYGLWTAVIINSALFIIFAYSFTKPKTRRDWRSFGAFSAFIVALFTEMYGVPVTIYLLSGWLQRRYPNVDPFSHDAGHIWWTITGQQGDPHTSFLHVLSTLFIFGGFILISHAWRVLYRAQTTHKLATTGAYSWIRHPQYVGFIAILLGFLLQWPTLLTIIMFPLLVWMYMRLAISEEKEAELEFGDDYKHYAATTPRWIPHWGGHHRSDAHDQLLS